MTSETLGFAGRSALLVLGMHRSGTSALSGVLSHLGYATPSTMMPAESDNPKGFFESRRVGDLNNQILGACGSSWHDWRAMEAPSLDSSMGIVFREKAATLIDEEFGDADHIVLKDPRISRVLPIWSDALAHQNYQPGLIITHRNPFEVAQSLLDRNGFPHSYSLLLYLRYMLDAERFTRGSPRTFTSYDRVLSDWRGALREIKDQLDLEFPCSIEAVASKVDAFISADLRHHAAARPDEAIHPILSGFVAEASEIMERWANVGEDSRDYNALDRLEGLISEASWSYSKMSSITAPRVEEIKNEFGAVKRENARMKSRLAEETKWRSVTERLLSDAQGALAEINARDRSMAEDRERQIQEMVVLTRLLMDAEDGIMAAEGRFRISQEQLEAAERRFSEEQARSQAAEQRYQAVVESSAWRLTAPMRRVADRLRSS